MSVPIMRHKGGPNVVKLQPGSYAWCRCGYSENHPFCDGAHARKDTGLRPELFKIEEEKTVALCACKKSATEPFCDGAHAK